jgi:hypothetical protein
LALGHLLNRLAHRIDAFATAIQPSVCQNAGRVTAGNDRSFPRDAVEIDRIELHVVGHGPEGTNIVEALTPLYPPHGSRLGTQQSADGINSALTHRLLLPWGEAV